MSLMYSLSSYWSMHLVILSSIGQADKVAAEENRREKEKEALAAQAAQAEIRAAERATTAR